MAPRPVRLIKLRVGCLKSCMLSLIARWLPFRLVGLLCPQQVEVSWRRLPTGSLRLCARCPALALLSEGLPASPHGHCVSLASSCSCSSGVWSPPPVRWCHFWRAGFSFHTLSLSLSLSLSVSWWCDRRATQQLHHEQGSYSMRNAVRNSETPLESYPNAPGS